MNFIIQSPKQALNKAFLKQRPLRSEIDLFKKNLIHLLGKIDEIEREENQKNHVRDFLRDTYYKESYEINTKDSKDLVIHLGKTNKDNVGVIIEAKRPSNVAEMFSAKKPNSKALHEIILYYLDERNNAGNNELKHLLITNVYEWYLIDANYFDKYIYRNNKVKKLYETYVNDKKDTPFFYEEISKIIPSIDAEIPYTYFDIRQYQAYLQNEDKVDDKNLIALQKILSPYHLLKEKFADDSNKLDDHFYKELLHIIGLEEAKDGGKTIIRRKEKNRYDASLLENTIEELKAEGLHKVPNLQSFGETDEEQYFNIALELCITWINRILFLKLLESQQISYHKGDKQYRFLNIETIFDFDELFKLFHRVLAVNTHSRKAEVQKKYSRVPYLNSSLFEISELEDLTIKINSLDDSLKLDFLPNTVLQQQKKEAVPLTTLNYFFQFLDAYDFASEGSEDIQEENKTLISASVLGLIFEKINGYKDGSFFTPSFITMYICKETISRAVLQAFNDKKGWACTDLVDLHNKIDNIPEANQIVNAIRVCDPAVGSGHFLVSALNQMIAIKSELGILVDKAGKRLKDYEITIENDELIVSDSDQGIFHYTPGNAESQRVQETLFQEKQTIIENCLFGVDLNLNSVRICQLRLWIELLKNTYYDKTTNELETLPNIDINIKCGNSLISRFGLEENLNSALKNTGYTVEQYKEAVAQYRNAESKEEKRAMYKLIEDIKKNINTEISKNDKNAKELLKYQKELNTLTAPALFERTEKEEKVYQKQLKEVTANLKKCEAKIDEIKNNKIYENALEWRFEFPEVLNEDGAFMGFDAIIGNPPYIQLQKLGAITDVYEKLGYGTFERTGDIYCLFYELGNNLLRPNAYLSFITSNKWMRAGYGESTRNYFVEHTNPLILIDFAGQKIFDEATVDVNILLFQKSKYEGKTQSCIIKEKCIENMSGFISENSVSNLSFKKGDSWVVLSAIEQRIKEKIEKVGKPLRDWDINIYRGILTGYNEAFIIDGKTKDELIAKSANSAEIIRPILRGRDIKRYGYEFADLWLIYIPWHFPLQNDPTITGASEKAEIEFEKQYPAIYNHLLKYKDQLQNRNKAETGIRYEWYALQRWGANYWEDFSRHKIVWKRVGSILKFCYDEEGCMALDSTCFATGKHVKYLTAFLNSKTGKYMLKDSPQTGTGDLLISVQAIEPLKIPLISEQEQETFNQLIDQIMTNIIHGIDSIKLEQFINKKIYSLFKFSLEEINFIEHQ